MLGPPASTLFPYTTLFRSPDAGARLPRLDVHMHVGPEGIDRLIKLMDRWGIDGAVNLSGMYPGPPRNMLETQLEAARKDRKSTRLNSSHSQISYAVFCLKK